MTIKEEIRPYLEDKPFIWGIIQRLPDDCLLSYISESIDNPESIGKLKAYTKMSDDDIEKLKSIVKKYIT